jgi:hemerythrin superfamily protein
VTEQHTRTPADERPETMPEDDLVNLLRHQHGLVHDLFDEARDPARGEDRRGTFQRLVRLLAVHETIEEEIVYPYARRTIDGGSRLVDDRLTEEHEAKEMLARLDRMEVTDPAFLPLLDKLRLAVLEHARSEERYEFSKLQAATSADERRTMAVAAKAAAAMAPTRPHPGVESAVANLLVGPPMAVIDRVRDVIRKALSDG